MHEDCGRKIGGGSAGTLNWDALDTAGMDGEPREKKRTTHEEFDDVGSCIAM